MISKIITLGRDNPLFKYVRIIFLLVVLNVPYVATKLIYVSKMGDVGVHTVFEKNACKMVL